MSFEEKKPRQFRFGLKSILVLTAIVAVGMVLRVQATAYFAYRGLSNEDIVLNGTPFGLIVELRSESADTFRKLGTDGNSWLVAALSDPSKCAAAHRLLVEINRDKYDAAQQHWDHQWDPNHSGAFSEKDIPELVRFWKTALE